jgi:hypothetical protein
MIIDSIAQVLYGSYLNCRKTLDESGGYNAEKPLLHDIWSYGGQFYFGLCVEPYKGVTFSYDNVPPKKSLILFEVLKEEFLKRKNPKARQQVRTRQI